MVFFGGRLIIRLTISDVRQDNLKTLETYGMPDMSKCPTVMTRPQVCSISFQRFKIYKTCYAMSVCVPFVNTLKFPIACLISTPD